MAHNFIRVSSAIRLRSERKSLLCELNVLTTGYGPKNGNFTANIAMQNREIPRASTRYLTYYGRGFWGRGAGERLSEWRMASEAIAQTLGELSQNCDLLFVFLSHARCIEVPRFAEPLGPSASVHYVCVPSGSAMIHHRFRGRDTIRVQWERQIARFASATVNLFYASIGQYGRQHLIQEFHTPASMLLPLSNGVIPTDREYGVNTVEWSRMEQVGTHAKASVIVAYRRPRLGTRGRPTPFDCSWSWGAQLDQGMRKRGLTSNSLLYVKGSEFVYGQN